MNDTREKPNKRDVHTILLTMLAFVPKAHPLRTKLESAHEEDSLFAPSEGEALLWKRAAYIVNNHFHGSLPAKEWERGLLTVLTGEPIAALAEKEEDLVSIRKRRCPPRELDAEIIEARALARRMACERTARPAGTAETFPKRRQHNERGPMNKNDKWDREAIYGARVAPLMDQLLKICKKEGLPIVCSIQYANDGEDAAALCTSITVNQLHASDRIVGIAKHHQPRHPVCVAETEARVSGVQPAASTESEAR